MVEVSVRLSYVCEVRERGLARCVVGMLWACCERAGLVES